MNNEESIKETLDVIRRALEDETSSDSKPDVLILNRKVNDDGTVDIIKDISAKKEDINNILDDKINKIFEKHLDLWLEEKLPLYIKKYFEDK
ncbi:MAG: hypothetical protein CMP16_04280 [Rickettsiales bacterium]|nr:hypothetical protein [Rickettsiales bacterium]|tara:strand:- start:1499 stop:1774 length:276 start_codon:yes stop_codon:yes gene_type:complete